MQSFFSLLAAAGGLMGLIVGIIQLYRWFSSPIRNWIRLRRKRRIFKKYIRLDERIYRLERNGGVESLVLRNLASLMIGTATIGIGLLPLNMHSDLDLAHQSWVPDVMAWPWDATDPAIASYFLAMGVLAVLIGAANLALSSIRLLKASYSVAHLSELRDKLKEIEENLSEEELDTLAAEKGMKRAQ